MFPCFSSNAKYIYALSATRFLGFLIASFIPSYSFNTEFNEEKFVMTNI